MPQTRSWPLIDTGLPPGSPGCVVADTGALRAGSLPAASRALTA
jgi:hypothetical protein